MKMYNIAREAVPQKCSFSGSQLFIENNFILPGILNILLESVVRFSLIS
jgi:hypothetical protein